MGGFRISCAALAVLGLALLITPALAEALPALPGGWPTTLQIGLSDGPGGAAHLKATTRAGFRYQYLGGGVNTGSGWATWNSNGSYVTLYIQESIAQGIIPVFSYYTILQSTPGTWQGEPTGIFTNLQTTDTMRAYYADLKLFFQRAGAFPANRVVLHVEPDLWGFMHSRRAVGDDGRSVPVRVASTGLPELAGLPDNAAGFAQAIARLRDSYARNVWLAYSLNVWGTQFGITAANASDATANAHATRAAAFLNSLGGRFDVVFGEFSDRDAGYYQHVLGDGGASWWDASDFSRFARYLSTFVAHTGKRVVLWQIPLGNTRMRAVNNTWQHYQDNRVEWLLDDPSRAHLAEYVQAGVIAFLFGRGADGNTCACDAGRDGVTNPWPINGNAGVSVSADDDGGFFRQRTAAYYAAGALWLGGGTSPAPPPPPSGVTLMVVRAGTGSGSVTSAPGGITCGTDCSQSYASGTWVTLSATAAAGSVFSGWSGSGCSGTGACSVAMSGTRSVTATFGAATAGPPGFTVTGTTASPDPAAPGTSTTIRTSVTNTGAAASGILVDMEVYNASVTKIHQQVTTGQGFQAGQQRSFQWIWAVPAAQPPGLYTVEIGIFSANWATRYTWQNNAGTVRVQSGGTGGSPTAGAPRFTVAWAAASPNAVSRGASTTISTSVTNAGGTASGIVVDMEVYNAWGTKIHQQVATGQSFQAGQQRTFQWTWPVLATQGPGVYTVKIGIFSANWATRYTWDNAAASVTVR
ncbi:MAG TPA: hypothetical protein VLD61_09010 [Methylomirabilota bacterium]|nr:hypothetical protein [Methylomirabilota bacterium]